MIKLDCREVRFLIKRKGLKVNWLAKEIGISRTYLELLIYQKRNPSEDVLKDLAKVLQVPQKQIGEKYEKALKDSNVSLNRNSGAPIKRRRVKSANQRA